MDVALEIGLAEFTMSSVAAALDVTTPALYSHVSGRDELLALAAGRVLEGIEAAVDDGSDWRTFLGSYAAALRSGLPGFDWSLFTELGRSSTAAVEIAERGLSVLTEAGFSPEDAAHALWLVARVALSAGTPERPSLQQQRSIAPDLMTPSESYPNLVTVTAIMDASSELDTLASDMEVVLDGLAVRLERMPLGKA